MLLILSSDPGLDLKEAFSRSLFLILAVVCKVQFSIQINDLSDREEDKAAGKRRWTGRLSYPFSLAVPMAFIALGLATAVFAGRSQAAILAYIVSTLLGLFYSSRPVRFKERGIWGLIVYALSATIIFVVVPWAWFDSSLFMLFILFAVVFSDKWVQIHFHQVVDYQNDRECGTRTFVLQIGLKRARSTLRGAAFLASFCTAGLLFHQLFLSKRTVLQQVVLLLCSAAVVAASGVYVRIIKRKPAASSALVKELPWIYLGLTYLVFYALPPLGFILLALKEPLMWIMVVLSALSLAGISRQSIRYQTQ